METENISAYCVVVLLAVLISLVVINLTRKHLYDLVNEVVKLPSAAVFYLRTFTIALVFLALSVIINARFTYKGSTPLMDYIWGIAGYLEDLLRYISFFLLGYLFLITLLVVIIRRRHDA